MKIEVSNGEIVDKLTILQIKSERIEDAAKLENVNKEFAYLKEVVKGILDIATDPLYKELYEVNCKLWDIEDDCRDLERAKDFGEKFIQTTRSVYFTNDVRAEIKKKINLKTGSQFTEEKSYQDYK